ncbi:phage tail tape measure C-terminal domain-containing protein [Pseudomonas sp. MB-090624]|uniref:phage tail tape measure C-terminal domain-containing protein n=1 Tax=Pseudomonas sp. MB-090624 TaxID=2213078 RepID=UPI000D83FC28|nr:phage tail tape measure C-terminal domain-containing protein [Pseudomonas sp. MB-090624]PYB88350.1 tail tape measure protein [Pseudomonas sp. MB-090624]
MASKSLGTLTLDVIAQVGGFVAGMDKAERSSAKWRREVEKNVKAAGVAIGAAAVAGVTALATMTVSAINSAAEVAKLAAVSNASTTDFQKMAAGAKFVGVEQDKLSDILKDVNDKVGDFLLNGGGELQDFFKTIAPKVGVTAEQFRNLSGPQALQLFASSLEKAGLSQAEMTQQMESLANDATLLLPLLRNNAEGFRTFGEAAEAAGSIMDEKTIRAATELKAASWLMESAISGVGTEIQKALLPMLSSFAGKLTEVTEDGVIVKKIADDLAESVKVLGKMAIASAGGLHIFLQSVKGLHDLDNAMVGGQDAKWYDRYLPPVRVYNAFKNFGAIGDSFNKSKSDIKGLIDMYGELWDGIDKPPGDGPKNQVKELADLLERLREGQAGSFIAPTTGQQAAAKAAETAAKKLLGQFDTAEEGYKRQIALINTETDKRKEATEVAKLQFELESGNLTGLSAKQQERLKGLAAELDQLKQLKQAKEDDKAVAGFDASVKRQLSIDQRTLDAPLKNAYSSDEMKQRALDLLAIEQNYQDQLEDLRQRHDAGDVSDSVYERETEILNKALNDRKAMQEKYYQDVDAMQQNGTAGFISGFATQAQAAMDLYSNMQSVGSAAFSSLTDMLTEWAETGKLNAKDFAATFIQSIGHSLLAYAAAQVAMAGLNAFTAMIGVPFVGPAIAPGAAIAAAAAAGVLMTGVGSALSGQAHAGIDNIPSEGTWLLDGGERVLSPAQNRDLTGYLQRANSVDATSKPGGVTMNVQVNQNIPAQVGFEQEGDQLKIFIREAKKQIAGDLARGNGDVSKALSQGWGVKRAAR